MFEAHKKESSEYTILDKELMGRFLFLKDNMFLSGRMFSLFKIFLFDYKVKTKQEILDLCLKYDNLEHESMILFRKKANEINKDIAYNYFMKCYLDDDVCLSLGYYENK